MPLTALTCPRKPKVGGASTGRGGRGPAASTGLYSTRVRSRVHASAASCGRATAADTARTTSGGSWASCALRTEEIARQDRHRVVQLVPSAVTIVLR